MQHPFPGETEETAGISLSEYQTEGHEPVPLECQSDIREPSNLTAVDCLDIKIDSELQLSNNFVFSCNDYE